MPADPLAGRLGLLAGGGALPVELATWRVHAGLGLFVVRLKGFADPALCAFEGAEVGIAELGRCFDVLRRAGCDTICFAGIVKRPDFGALRPDLRGMAALPRALAAARAGDDALLRFLVAEFEGEGFRVVGAHQVSAGMLLAEGPAGGCDVADACRADLDLAWRVAGAVGALDIGQAVVVCDGLVLAVEAQEGTDSLLRRCAELPPAIRGTPDRRRGVLVKRAKPTQERRTDLPVIGVSTLKLAAAAGLAGVAGEAEATLLIDREATVAAADRLGLFLAGIAHA